MKNTGWELEPAILRIAVLGFCERNLPLLCLWLPLPVLIYFDHDKKRVVVIGLILTQFLFSWLSIWSTKRFYDHYFLLLVPSLCIGAGYSVDRMLEAWKRGPKAIAWTAGVFMAVALFVATVSSARAAGDRVERLRAFVVNDGSMFDEISEVSRWLLQHGSHGEVIYVIDGNPMIYFLSDAVTPTRFVFPPFLIHKFFQEMAEVDRREELNGILAKRPMFVVRRIRPLWWLTPSDYAFLNEAERLIEQDYVIAQRFNELEILQRRR